MFFIKYDIVKTMMKQKESDLQWLIAKQRTKTVCLENFSETSAFISNDEESIIDTKNRIDVLYQCDGHEQKIDELFNYVKKL